MYYFYLFSGVVLASAVVAYINKMQNNKHSMSRASIKSNAASKMEHRNAAEDEYTIQELPLQGEELQWGVRKVRQAMNQHMILEVLTVRRTSVDKVYDDMLELTCPDEFIRPLPY